jgi:hypothetical protein
MPVQGALSGLAGFLPAEVLTLNNPQTDIPRIAKDERLTRLIEEAVQQIPTSHTQGSGKANSTIGFAKHAPRQVY